MNTFVERKGMIKTGCVCGRIPGFKTMLGIDLPIIQAPMAGSALSNMAIAVSESGGLGSLPSVLLSAEQMRNEYGMIRHHTQKPVSLNFFCHPPSVVNADRENRWRKRLESYYIELGITPTAGRRNASKNSRL